MGVDVASAHSSLAQKHVRASQNQTSEISNTVEQREQMTQGLTAYEQSVLKFQEAIESNEYKRAEHVNLQGSRSWP